jgi:DNA-binding CsgD family transcriptional regulator
MPARLHVAPPPNRGRVVEVSAPIRVVLADDHAAMRHRSPTDDRLTPREVEVLRLIALGHTSVEIARQLNVSPRTIETHRAHVHGKLGLGTRAELVRYALRCGLLN